MISDNAKKHYLHEVFSQMSALLATIDAPASFDELKRLLYLTSDVTPQVSKLPPADLRKLLGRMERENIIVNQEDTWTLCDRSPRHIRHYLTNPRWQKLPDCVARALPAVSTRGSASLEFLSRDLRNGFYAQDEKLIFSTLNTLQNILPQEYEDGVAFDFIAKADDIAWLLDLQPNILSICATQFLPIAIRHLLPITPLADKFFELAAEFPPRAIYPLADYELLCGNWPQASALLKRCSHNYATQLRKGWLAFVVGLNDKALNCFGDALYEARQKDSHDFYFQTVGGLFFVLANIRQDSPDSLVSGENNALLGAKIPFWQQAYEGLNCVIQSKMHKDTPSLPFPLLTSLDNPIGAFFLFLSEYWLTSRLAPERQTMLRQLADRAETGSYTWLSQECRELLYRVENDNASTAEHRWHDMELKNIPYVIDSVPVRNSWLSRLDSVNNFLSGLNEQPIRRLVWYVQPADDNCPCVSVKPLEQHQTKGTKWSKGRKFTAYRNQDYCQLDADLEIYMQNYRLSAHDKYACTILRRTLEQLEQGSIDQRTAWTLVFRALVDHPLLFLDAGNLRSITCKTAQPYIKIASIGANYEFRVEPAPVDNSSIVLKTDSGGNILLFIYEQEHKQLRKLFGQDFKIPKDSSTELGALIAKLAPRYTIVSDIPLLLPNIPADEANARPYIKLVPEAMTLRVSFNIHPFAAQPNSYEPGLGPCEIIAPSGSSFRRVVRNFNVEKQRCLQAMEQCPALQNAEAQGEWEWLMNSQLDCFELTQQLSALNDQVSIAWPEDKSFTPGKVIGSSNLSLHTQSYKDWFGVDGTVQIDENTTMTIQELMQKASEHNNRYIVLDNGQLVALSEKFRKKLEDLNRLGELAHGGEGLRVNRFLLPLLADTLADVEDIRHSPLWNSTLKQIDDGLKLKPEIPPNLNASLRPYQVEGYEWLSRLDAIQAGACLADDMGLGKTLQAIALVISKASEGPSLIVAPTSVCTNWLTEFNRFAPSLKVSIFGPGNRIDTLSKLGPGHVLICSYGLLQSENSAFEKREWRVAVLDEAQAIKNYNAKRSQAALHIRAKFKLVTTGTPLENNLNELWAIFSFILPGLLGTRDHFQRRFTMPIERDDTEANREIRQEAHSKLLSIIRPFLMRRQKSQVLKELPPKEDIIWRVELPDEERVFYEAFKRQILSEIEQKGDTDSKLRIKVLAGITKLRLALCHPSLVRGGENLSGAKLETFLDLLTDILANGHKTLVFSQFVKFLTVVRAALEERGIAYQYLDGNMNSKERNKAVTEFQEGNCPVFLISLKAGGLGLNLTQADYVIHLDSWWNPAVENQASDRAYRFGQDKKVTIYHLVTANTIEERIQAMHEKKQNLADSILDGNDKAEQLSLEMLFKLLKED